jgi:hypothetical protein
MYFFQSVQARSQRRISVDESVADQIGQMEEVRLRRFLARVVAFPAWALTVAVSVTHLTTGPDSPMLFLSALATAVGASWLSHRYSRRLDGLRNQMIELISSNRKETPHGKE